MTIKIAVIEGDGIGPEVIEQALRVLSAVDERFGLDLEFEKVWAGGKAYEKFGDPLPGQTLSKVEQAEAVLLGAVGDPKWDDLPADKRPEKALFGLRKHLGLFANLRPVVLFPQLASACPLKDKITRGGLDILIVRELTGGIYFGEKRITDQGAYDTLFYSEPEVSRIVHVAMRAAQKRGKNVVSVDKANVLESSRLWRRVAVKTAKSYPQISLRHLYVDNAAMQLIRDPSQFDVIVTDNMFGDILSDEAAMLTGSIGMLPSASVGEGKFGLYEPVHGSAPDIAGQQKANPLATILSAAMMLRYTFLHEEAALCIEKAVQRTLEDGVRTVDIAEKGDPSVSTAAMGEAVCANL